VSPITGFATSGVFIFFPILRIAARMRAATVARKAKFVEAIQRDLPSPVPHQKIFRFAVYPNQIYIARHPVPTKGRFAIVTSVRRDAVDAEGAARRTALEADGEVVWS
jgi:hypothetical protein